VSNPANGTQAALSLPTAAVGSRASAARPATSCRSPLSPGRGGLGPGARRQILALLENEDQGKIFCLVEAPPAAAVHSEAHGLIADDIYQVEEGA
jgi:hypothetical protein